MYWQSSGLLKRLKFAQWFSDCDHCWDTRPTPETMLRPNWPSCQLFFRCRTSFRSGSRDSLSTFVKLSAAKLWPCRSRAQGNWNTTSLYRKFSVWLHPWSLKASLTNMASLEGLISFQSSGQRIIGEPSVPRPIGVQQGSVLVVLDVNKGVTPAAIYWTLADVARRGDSVKILGIITHIANTSKFLCCHMWPSTICHS